MQGSVRRVVWLGLALLMLGGLARGQRERSSIGGRVSDASGAVIPGVAITITNTHTGVSSHSETNGEGIYTVSALPVGIYRVEAKKEGFKTAVADNIDLGVAQQVTMDLTLQIGEIAEKVTVTSETPLLETTAEIGSAMTDQVFHELPITIDEFNGRQPQTFIFSSLPGSTGNSFSGSINGGQLFSHEVLVDGIAIARYDISGGSISGFNPSVEAIGEFKLQANNYSAQYGESQSGIVSFQMKSGTNELHGNLYEYHRDRLFNAAGWRVNTFAPNGVDAAGKAIRAQNVQNNFGGTVGGPVFLPKVYNGRNKTFFFFSYDSMRVVTKPRGSLMTFPTSDQLEGDFSRLLDLSNEIGVDALGRPVFQGALYDPATTRPIKNGSIDPATGLMATQDGFIRDAFGFNPVTGAAFPGQANIIPQSRWSKVSGNIIPFYKEVPRINDNLFRNLARSGTNGPYLHINTVSIKVDHAFTDRHKFSSMFNYNDNPGSNGVVFFGGGPIGLDQSQHITGRMARVSEDWTINNHWLNHFGFGYNRFANPNVSKVFEEDWAGQIGLTGASSAHFPQSNFGTSCFSPSELRLGCIGSTSGSFGVSESWILLDDMSYTFGKHQLKWGGELRRYRYNNREKGGTSGIFTWSNNQTSLPGFQATYGGGLFETGWPFASFVLGTAERASRAVIPTQVGVRQGLYVLYFQDDWRATPKLTFSYGLRWDVPTPRGEAFDRMSSFDPNVPNPGADNRPGALVFLKGLGRGSFQDRYYREFGPRFGVAYQLTSKTVLRGGYGITYAPPIADAWCCNNAQGFNSSIVVSHSTPDPRFGSAPNPWDPVLQWDNGIPPYSGNLPNTDPASENFDHSGNYVDWLRRDSLRQPYVQLWSLGVQRELPLDSVLEVNYVGSKGTRLIASIFSAAVNAAPTKFMSMLDSNGNALVNKTFGDLTPSDWTVLNSFGVKDKPYPSFPNDVPIAQALKTYPQYAGINDVYPNFGSSNYHSAQVSWRKRPTHGLTFIASYTFSKTLTNSESGHTYHKYGSPYSGYYNITQWPESRHLEKSVADFDIPQALKLTWVYEFPVGRGRRFLNQGGAVDKILGGWKITAVQNYLSGSPLVFSSYIPAAIATGPFGNGHWATRPDMVGDWSGVKGTVVGPLDPAGTPYLNVPSEPDAQGCKGPFCPVPTTADGYALHPGNAPRVFGNIRGPGKMFEDFGVIKATRINERVNVEFMTNFFNVFNRHGFGNPDPVVDSPTFGRILNPAQGPRTIQFVLRLNF